MPALTQPRVQADCFTHPSSGRRVPFEAPRHFWCLYLSEISGEPKGGFTQGRQAGELSEGAQSDWTQLPRGLHTHLQQPESTQAWWDEKKSYVVSHG
jgi:hypothetical protein